MSELASLHATSYHFLQTYPGGLSCFEQDYSELCIDGWFTKSEESDNTPMEKMFVSIFASGVEVFKKCSPETEEFQILSRKLEDYQKVRTTITDKIHKAQGDFVVLAHNDAWINNLLFK